jgi:murein DD-endopeptidase / murein LD-carboxypeptidase
MPMKKKVFLFASACFLLSILIFSCHPGRRAARRHAAALAAENANRKPAATQPPKTVPDAKSIRQKYADILGVKPKQIENITLYAFIDAWYGTKYRIGGNDRSGIDCSGFARKLYDQVYRVDLVRTAVEQFGRTQRVKNPDNAMEGDLVFFRINSKQVSHVGVYLANNFFVHVSTSKGVIISSLNEPYWQKYFEGIGRIPRRG